MKLSFIGAGYVGLVTGACMAELGHNVICADIDETKIEKLNNNVMPIYEPGLEELVVQNVEAGRLSFTTDIADAIQQSAVVFSCVGTPEDKQTGQADLKYVRAVATTFAENLNGYKILVNKSTVPVGTADEAREIINNYTEGKIEFDVVSNPEFLREGTSIKDFLKPDRVVLGIPNEKSKKIMQEVYAPLQKESGAPILFMDIKSAEITKYAANAFLATKISFINEIANFCDIAGGNVKDIARGIGMDKRIGEKFLSAGIGYGGSCFPKDVEALLQTGKEKGYEFKVIKAADEVNDTQKLKPLEILKKNVDSLNNKKVAILGLAFKPNTDDIREAPALEVINKLLEENVAKIFAHDPVAVEITKNQLNHDKIEYYEDLYEAISDSDAVLLMTDWDDYKNIDLKKAAEAMQGKLIIDGRNMLNKKDAGDIGLDYYGIGV